MRQKSNPVGRRIVTELQSTLRGGFRIVPNRPGLQGAKVLTGTISASRFKHTKVLPPATLAVRNSKSTLFH